MLRGALVAALLLPGGSPQAAPAVVLPHDIEASLDQIDSLGRFYGALAIRDPNGFAQERWQRLSQSYPGTAAILRDLLARGLLHIDDLPEGRVSAVLDRGEIVVDRELDGRWRSDPAADDDGLAVQRRDLLLPALFEALARRQPPQDWPWLADHLRAVGGFGALAQDPLARPLLVRFFQAKDAYLWLALQRIGEGNPAARRILAARQSATFDSVRGLETDMAATFGAAPAERIQRDWADYVAEVDGFAVTRSWRLFDPALSRTQLGEAARRDADAVNRAAAEVVASTPRSAVAAARQGAPQAASRRVVRQRSAAPPRKAPEAIMLDSIVAQAASPDLEALAAELPLRMLAAKPAATAGLDSAAVRAFLARIEEAVAQQPDLQATIAEREQQLGAARSELATLESKVEALAAAAEARAEEAERLQAALAAERAQRGEVEALLAATQAGAAAGRDGASAESRPLPQITVLPPAAAAERPAAAPAGVVDLRVAYAVAAAVGVLLLVVLGRAGRRRHRAAAPAAPLLLTASAAEELRVGFPAPGPAPQPASAAERPTRQPGAAIRINGVEPSTVAARAAMRAGSARHAAVSAASAPAGEADAAAHSIVQALRQGNLPLFELLFGELTDLRTPQLQRIVYGGRGEDLAIVCRAVGVDKLWFGSIYMLTDHLRSSDAEEEAERTSEILRLYERMPPSTARKVLAKWQRDWSDRCDKEPSTDV